MTMAESTMAVTLEVATEAKIQTDVPKGMELTR